MGKNIVFKIKNIKIIILIYKMAKTIIYSCVFFNEKYIHLINLLLKSYKLFGNSPYDVDYLIICNPNFQKKNPSNI